MTTSAGISASLHLVLNSAYHVEAGYSLHRQGIAMSDKFETWPYSAGSAIKFGIGLLLTWDHVNRGCAAQVGRGQWPSAGPHVTDGDVEAGSCRDVDVRKQRAMRMHGGTAELSHGRTPDPGALSAAWKCRGEVGGRLSGPCRLLVMANPRDLWVGPTSRGARSAAARSA